MPQPQVVADTAIVQAPLVMQTSLAANVPHQATVRFRRFAQFGGTAYQQGQEAGFSNAKAALIQRSGAGDVVPTRAVAAMVTK